MTDNKHPLWVIPVVFLSVVIILFAIRGNGRANEFRWEMGISERTGFSILSVNVGNSDLSCQKYDWKLCRKDVEGRLTENIARLKPDIIAFQELLAPWQCEKTQETDPEKVCYDEQEEPQVRRLLGDDYSIVCDNHKHFECTAVLNTAGEIIGCPIGSHCNLARTSPIDEGCRDRFSISAVTVKLRTGVTFDVVNMHPQNITASCRSQLLRKAFLEEVPEVAIIQEAKVLLIGDFNLDPWRDNDESFIVWQQIFQAGWDGQPYQYHSGIAEKDPPYYTFKFVIKKTLDFAVSNFATGQIIVLGESPGTMRLDGGSGNDHRALFGFLEFPP
ncbi:MAG: hypothetical protein GTO14_03905 [Anaerolineales bacterium]|nr:hypothetical protein [Anaerolineales bacterium]